ncbi:MAG TPA: sortase [Candidatus Limnocylindrales bacterium]|nr:sortase [Candidatus Limnocylindrales bacterium]
MRKGRGPRALWALAGAFVLVIASSTEALGMAPDVRTAASAEEGRAVPSLTLGANLDRSPLAPYQELARTSAVSAAFARAHPVPPTRDTKTTSRPTAPIIRNHLWIPALGISRTVFAFPCWRRSAPANYVYRWGCAGRNNVYLLGHAWGVFKALHDAYVSGRLNVGMEATYADGNGHITHYRITTWQVVSPTNTTWSRSTRVPSMTLQTCVGPNSEYRLDVRLVSY